MTCVSWDDAQEYVSWLTRTTDEAYRLPTEAEWDRAAAGSQAGCQRRPEGTTERSLVVRMMMKMMLARLAVATVLVLVASSAVAERLALVVGNDVYTSPSMLQLQNAVNDARAVAAALEEVGFTVTKVENATRAQLSAALGRFVERLQGDDVALFYFAGHGMQVEQTNYLIPTDYAGQTAAEVRLSAFSAVEVEDMLRRARVAMLVFDACRNTPPAYRGMRGGGTGLAAMEARGTLIAFAAGAGEYALDAAPGEANGLFTAKLLEALRVPGLTATALFQQVRREVYSASQETQFPAVYDNCCRTSCFGRAIRIQIQIRGWRGCSGSRFGRARMRRISRTICGNFLTGRSRVWPVGAWMYWRM